MSSQAADDNPYDAPVALDAISAAPWSWRPRRWMAAWTVIYGVNLIIPLLFANGTVRGNGTLGMVLAMVAMWGVSLWLCGRSARLRACLMTGSVAVGLSQVVPFLHIMAGLVAIGAAQWLARGGQAPEEGALRGLGEVGGSFGLGFLATVFTGGFLMMAALGLGLVLTALGRLIAGRSGVDRPV